LHIEAIGFPWRCREHRRSPVTDSRADRRGHDRPDAADAWPTAGLIVTVSFDEEFIEELIDVEYTDSQSTIELGLSGDAWTLVAILMKPHRFGVRTVEPRHNDSYAVSMSTQKLRNVARESVYKGGFRHIGPDPDEPPLSTGGTQTATTRTVAGAMRGSHHAPLFSVGADDTEVPSSYDGPPLVKAVGMVLNDGEFSEPASPFDCSFWTDSHLA